MTEEFSEKDIIFIRRALELASLGSGQVSPNPLVGCVIVSPNDEIIGEGTYIYEKVVHAEAIALEQAGEKAKGATAYVSLEPHDHYGKTPPCSLALINAGIKRVVCSIQDPNPLVSGSGFKRLRENNVEVVEGVLAEEATRLNEKFVCWHQKKRPFVHLKMALSLDGRISLKKSVSTALTGKLSRAKVQLLRYEHDAILVGGNTVASDNPNLTDRTGKRRRRKLMRVVLDNRLQIPLDSIPVQTALETPTTVFSNSQNVEKVQALQEKGVVVFNHDARDLQAVLAELRKLEIQSVLVEGGTEVAGSFCNAGLVDKVSFFYAPLLIGGQNAPMAIGGRDFSSLNETLKLKDLEIYRHGNDFEVVGYPQD